ncbi:hypothetical protein BC936DRAFT_148689 [Jimgerdemannia flammicorona]|uniref:Calcineurin-like phosphoesterase domain-containing protein n=1 Tax=Jimgerdemannia flammicorona TaxID=994334 RepID=A0A433DNA0_9FUNG|nr:hypothetical protein BC936DRAFT_148689 [Jimgerdemannia flammicorona]
MLAKILFIPIALFTLLGQTAIARPYCDRDRTHRCHHWEEKFLHVTDIHVDTTYLEGSDPKQLCHRVSDLASNNTTGVYGALGTDCDSPISLVESSFGFMRKHLQNIDFIIYTGTSNLWKSLSCTHYRIEIPATDIVIDFTIVQAIQPVIGQMEQILIVALTNNVRYSQDRDVVVLRTSTDVLSDHKMIVDYFHKNFDMKHIKFIPTLGNNDVYLHDQIAFGPQSLLTNLTKLWAPFNLDLGETFANSGYFTQDILPGKLQVISMNTVYFYSKNLLVSDCDEAGSAGDVQLQWIWANLQKARHSRYNVYLMQAKLYSTLPVTKHI